MNEAALRGFARAFCEAVMLREPQRIASFLHDDVDWMGFGPVDLFPFLGRRKGAAAVLQVCKELGDTLELTTCHPENALATADQAAALIRLNAVHRESKRQISLRIAQFAEFRDGKLISLRAILDSFDAAEQMLGRSIDLTTRAG